MSISIPTTATKPKTAIVLHEGSEHRRPWMYQAECAWYRDLERYTAINYQKDDPEGFEKYGARIARVEGPQFIFLDNRLVEEIALIDGISQVMVSQQSNSLYIYIESFDTLYTPIFDQIEDLVADTFEKAKAASKRRKMMSNYQQPLGVC